MLSYEWREFEQLSARIGHLQIRRSAAASSRNYGLINMLTEEIANAERHRDQLVGHMSTRLLMPLTPGGVSPPPRRTGIPADAAVEEGG